MRGLLVNMLFLFGEETEAVEILVTTISDFLVYARRFFRPAVAVLWNSKRAFALPSIAFRVEVIGRSAFGRESFQVSDSR